MLSFKKYTAYSITLNLFLLAFSIIITMGFLAAYMLRPDWILSIMAIGGILFSFMMLGASNSVISNVKDHYSRNLQREKAHTEKLNAMSDAQFIKREVRNNLLMAGLMLSALIYSVLDLLYFDVWGLWLSVVMLAVTSLGLTMFGFIQVKRHNWRVCVEGDEKHIHVTDRSFNRCMKKANKYVQA